MAALKASGADGDTLVLLTSDNGSPVRGDAATSGNGGLRGYKTETWEGGYREPGIARWPGHIRPGSASKALVGTIDIHATLISLAGASTTVGGAAAVLIDGLDLSPIFAATKKTTTTVATVATVATASATAAEAGRAVDGGHDCIYMYHAAVAADAETGLSAVRCGAHKAYYWTPNGDGDGLPAPYSPGRQSPPLMFDLEADPSETAPLSPSGAVYGAAMRVIDAAKTAHLATITPVPNQNGRGADRKYAICLAVPPPEGAAAAAAAAGAAAAAVPNCTLSPENWRPAPICDSAACLAANPGFAARCNSSVEDWVDEDWAEEEAPVPMVEVARADGQVV